MSYETLNLSMAGTQATVTLKRPEVRNAFNEIMLAELTTVFAALSEHETVRVVVLAAEGKAFCAGADLNWMQRMAGFSAAENRADAACLAAMLSTIYRCRKPVIARVSGDVYAGGVGLVAACDIVVALDNARFCLSEARLGLIPATIAPYVIRALGEQASRRYFLSAEVFDCATAWRLGLVSEIAADVTQLDACVQQLSDTLSANGPAAVRACKQLVQDIAGQPLDDALMADTVERIAQVRSSAEGREGVASFLGKRVPRWRV
ncbi:enoyl-CoA hydratase/isomerase family protein [Paraburkholderia bonniea]|uniref:enoyl-CoA hydratase/isomerase family protein n=1 Tax=Paraburkholderia bonniea TaxID=2152891 RepID=UPI0012921593|nr:enoyl-CoA hydratase/isomerase family protein [Paraburkholderia bonniea]WJF92084.1 enoyl-CoA hydratase/isomerase family protein [Paraburkholderia bonniea]WJF95404.1 enoyl-CoA hydratase/isomerase family protein [Paraburkholderia bonniea]